MTGFDPDADNVVELHPSWREAEPRQIAAEDWLRYERHVGEIFAAFGMDLDTPGTRETPQRFLRALYDATAGYEGDPKLLTAFPAERSGASTAAPSQIVEGPISFYSALRAPLAAVPRHGVDRLHRRRADHRHLEADPAGAAVSRGGSRCRSGSASRSRTRSSSWCAARRRGLPRGRAPVHGDARRRGAVAHGDDLLAGAFERAPSCGASSSTRCAPAGDSRCGRAALGARRAARVRSSRQLPRSTRARSASTGRRSSPTSSRRSTGSWRCRRCRSRTS